MKPLNKKFIGGLTVFCLSVLIAVFFVTKQGYKTNSDAGLEGEIFDLYNILDSNFEEFQISISPKAESEDDALKMAEDFAAIVNGMVEPKRPIDNNTIVSSIGLDYEEEQDFKNITARFWYDVE